MGDITNNAQNYPAQGDYTTWQNLADMIGGVGADLTGQPYQVYRVTSASNGDVIQDANKIFDTYPIVRTKYKPGDLNRMETDPNFVAYWNCIYGDMSPMLTADIFVQNDPVYGQGSTGVPYPTNQINGICFGMHPPGAPALGARVDRLIKVYRTPLVPIGNYNNTTFGGMVPLECIDGIFRLGSVHAGGCLIPAGFLPEKRARGILYTGVGDMPPKTTMRVYVMPLNGFLFSENDLILADDGAHYRVINPYYQETGAVGNQLVLEREVSNGQC